MSAYFTQAAIQNSLPVLEEIVSLHEQEEEEMIRKEIAKRRTRLGAAGPEELQKEVNREILGSSRVRILRSLVNLCTGCRLISHLISFQTSIARL